MSYKYFPPRDWPDAYRRGWQSSASQLKLTAGQFNVAIQPVRGLRSGLPAAEVCAFFRRFRVPNEGLGGNGIKRTRPVLPSPTEPGLRATSTPDP